MSVEEACQDARLQPAAEHLQVLFRTTSALAVVMFTPDGRIASWNPGAERLLGYASDEIVGRHVSVLDADGELDGGAADLWLAGVTGTGRVEREGWGRRSDGIRSWVRVLASTLRDECGQLRGFVAVAHEASEQRATQLALVTKAQEMERLATTDPLTGLTNRRGFDEALRSIARGQFSALAIDVDNLKQVNDQRGHSAGDWVLRSVATTLSLMARRCDVVARVGGDEFAILMPGTRPQDAPRIAERMRSAVHRVPSGLARISVGWASGLPGTDPGAV